MLGFWGLLCSLFEVHQMPLFITARVSTGNLTYHVIHVSNVYKRLLCYSNAVANIKPNYLNKHVFLNKRVFFLVPVKL